MSYIDNIFYNIIIKDEGGWKITNHLTDLGGLTVAGLAVKFQTLDNQAWLKSLNETDLQKKDVQEKIVLIYKSAYTPVYLNNLPNISQPAILSIIVNRGQSSAAKIIQQSLGVNPDGVIGKITINSLNNLSDINTFCKNINKCWMESYIDTVIKNPNQIVNLKGWLRRVSRYATIDTNYANKMGNNLI